MRRQPLLAGLLVALLGSGVATAREAVDMPLPTERPVVGLALSGGGARGYVHIGVLRVLEELGVPIDLVAGTSIGAVVGGFYAAGLSPDEIERELASLDWARVFRGRSDREALSFRRKEDDSRYIFDLDVGIQEGRVRVPSGAVSPQELEFLLRKYTLPVAAIDDFDALPIPFRAVASDVVTGEAVVLGEGSLAVAIRASMAIPGLFPPIEHEERLLVDGGLVDNLPVDLARAMGADVVIAVDAGTPLLGRAELDSMTAISSQAQSLAMERGILEQRARADVLIVPPLAGIGPLEYPRVAEIAQRGEQAARQRADELAAIVARTGRAAPRPDLAAPPPPVVADLRLEGNSRVDSRLILARVRTSVGERLDLELLREDLGRIQQLDEFVAVRFALEDIAGERADLVIRVEEKPWGPRYLRFGARFEDDFEGNNSYDLYIDHTWTSLNSRGAEWRFDAQVGQTRLFATEIYQPLDYQGRFFAVASSEHRLAVDDVFADGRRIGEYGVQSLVARLAAGVQFGRYGELRLAVERGTVDTDVRVGAADLPEVDRELGGWRLRLAIDRLDSIAVPRDGSLGTVEVYRSEPGLGADDPYTRLSASHSRFLTRGRHTVFVAFEGGGPVGSTLPAYDEFVRGGLFSFSGYAPGELRGQYFGVVRAGTLYRIRTLPPTLGTAVYAGGWVEYGDVWQRRDDVGWEDLRGAVTVTLAAETRFGPVYLAQGINDDGRSRFQLSLGSRF